MRLASGAAVLWHKTAEGSNGVYRHIPFSAASLLSFMYS